jgi:hypothetical protein
VKGLADTGFSKDDLSGGCSQLLLKEVFRVWDQMNGEASSMTILG